MPTNTSKLPKPDSTTKTVAWVNERTVAKGFGENVDKLIQVDGMKFPNDEQTEKRVVSDLVAAGQLDDGIDVLMRKLSQFLRHEDFYYLRYAIIYHAMLRIHLRGDKIDVQAICHELKTRDEKAFENIGGQKFIESLALPIPNNTETHARNVVRLAIRRAVILAGYKKRILGQRTELELGELVDEIKHIDREIMARISMLDERNVYDMSVYQKQYIMQMIEDAENPEFVPGIPIWITRLNAPLYAWIPNNLYTIAAGTGMGKSQMLINAALDVAKQGKNVVLITLELSIEKIFDRILAVLTGISGENVKKRKFKDSDKAKLLALANDPNNPLNHLWIVPMNTPNMSEIGSKLDELYYRTAFEFVCIDYLGVETVSYEGFKYPGATEHAAQMWQKMREIKGNYGVPFLVATQVNRNYRKREDKRPILTDIANSSVCEKASDVVMLFHRMSVVDNLGKINHGDIEIAKNRDGANGQLIDVWFNEANGQIKDWPEAPDVDEVEL